MKLHIPVFAAAAFALAATAGAQNPVKWAVEPVSSVAPGGETSVKLVATIDEGWHIYSLTQPAGGPIPSRISLPEGQPFTLNGDIKADPPAVNFDKNFNLTVETYEKNAGFSIPVKADKSVKKGTQQVLINARYQVCNASMCIPPKTVKLTADVKVKSSSKSSKTAKSAK